MEQFPLDSDFQQWSLRVCPSFCAVATVITYGSLLIVQNLSRAAASDTSSATSSFEHGRMGWVSPSLRFLRCFHTALSCKLGAFSSLARFYSGCLSLCRIRFCCSCTARLSILMALGLLLRRRLSWRQKNARSGALCRPACCCSAHSQEVLASSLVTGQRRWFAIYWIERLQDLMNPASAASGRDCRRCTCYLSLRLLISYLS